MDSITLKAAPRIELGRKNYKLRIQDRVPAVVYGPDMDPKNISVNVADFTRIYKKTGESTLVDLDLDGGKKIKVLIQDIQRDAVKGFPIHIDFRQIDMNKPVETTVSLTFVGESAAVKNLGGTLIKPNEEIEIRCLPHNLVNTIEVDLGKLETFDDVLHVSDINMPEGIESLTDLKRTIALVEMPRTKEEMEALDEVVEADVEAVKVEGGDEAADEASVEKPTEEAQAEEKTAE